MKDLKKEKDWRDWQQTIRKVGSRRLYFIKENCVNGTTPDVIHTIQKRTISLCKQKTEVVRNLEAS